MSTPNKPNVNGDYEVAIGFAGSIDSGQVDAQLTLPPHKCASDDTYATQTEVQAAVSDLHELIDEQEERLSDLAQRLRNLEHGQPSQPLPADVLEFMRDVAHGPCASVDPWRAWQQVGAQATTLLRKYGLTQPVA